MVCLRIQSFKMRLLGIFSGSSKIDSNRYGGPFSQIVRDDKGANRSFTPRSARSRQRPAFHDRLYERGFTTLGGCLVLLSAIAGLGLYKIITRTETLTRTQVSLDQCTGSFAINLRSASLTIEQSYSRLETYREACIAACAIPAVCPEALALFQSAARVEKLIEEAAKLYWEGESLVWSQGLNERCHLSFLTEKSPFPTFNFPIVDPDLDLFGLEQTRFEMNAPTIRLKLQSSPIVSVSQLKRENDHDWTLRWIE